jgi:uncharacterized protein (TIGR03067 family)
MRFGIAMGLVVSLLVGADALTQDAPKNAVALQGTWKLSAGEADGKALPEKELKDGQLVIKGEHYTVTLPGRETVKGMQKLDPAKEPKTISTSWTPAAPTRTRLASASTNSRGTSSVLRLRRPGKLDRRNSPLRRTAGNGCTSGSA